MNVSWLRRRYQSVIGLGIELYFFHVCARCATLEVSGSRASRGSAPGKESGGRGCDKDAIQCFPSCACVRFRPPSPARHTRSRQRRVDLCLCVPGNAVLALIEQDEGHARVLGHHEELALEGHLSARGESVRSGEGSVEECTVQTTHSRGWGLGRLGGGVDAHLLLPLGRPQGPVQRFNCSISARSDVSQALRGVRQRRQDEEASDGRVFWVAS